MDRTEFGYIVYDVMIQEYDDLLIENVEHEFSQIFEKKIEKLIKRRRKPYFRMINTVGKRVACIALAVFIATATTVMSVDALRNAVFNFFINIFSDHSDIEAVDDAQHPDTIEDIYEISYDLSNYKINNKIYDSEHRYTEYIHDTDVIGFHQYTSLSFKNLYINTEDASITHIDINGYDTIYYYDNNNYHTYIWDNGRYIFMVLSNLSNDKVIGIINSIKKVESE